MRRRFLAAAGVLTAMVAVLAIWSPSVAGQNARPAKAKAFTPPKMPWGEPDISGNFTNVYEQATPLERPDEFAGVSRNDISGQRLADILAKRRDDNLERFDGGSDIHAPTFWWADSLQVEKGSHAWFIVDPPDGKVPSLTPQAQQRIAARADARRQSGRGAADSYEDRSLYDRCITRGLPNSMMPAIYGNSYRIVQSPGIVAIQYEMIHETRIIPLDGRSHVSRSLKLDMGDARGHWEGDTLVVETTNFNDRSVYRNANAATLRLTERFQRIAPDKVQWAVTVEDPQTWTRPWSFSMPLTQDDKEAMLEYGCHEGNLGLYGIISGARADEKAGVNRAIPTAAEGER